MTLKKKQSNERDSSPNFRFSTPFLSSGVIMQYLGSLPSLCMHAVVLKLLPKKDHVQIGSSAYSVTPKPHHHRIFGRNVAMPACPRNT
jgi:hypothetical protein